MAKEDWFVFFLLCFFLLVCVGIPVLLSRKSSNIEQQIEYRDMAREQIEKQTGFSRRNGNQSDLYYCHDEATGEAGMLNKSHSGVIITRYPTADTMMYGEVKGYSGFFQCNIKCKDINKYDLEYRATKETIPECFN